MVSHDFQKKKKSFFVQIFFLEEKKRFLYSEKDRRGFFWKFHSFFSSSRLNFQVSRYRWTMVFGIDSLVFADLS